MKPRAQGKKDERLAVAVTRLAAAIRESNLPKKVREARYRRAAEEKLARTFEEFRGRVQ